MPAPKKTGLDDMLSVADATMTPEAKILEHLEQISFHLKRLDALRLS